MLWSPRLVSLIGLILLPVSVSAETGLLYFTDFDSFDPGPDKWHDQDGWFANSAARTIGIQGIDSDIVPVLGRTAFLGANPPQEDWNYVAKRLDHDPVVEGSERIEIDTLIGITDSTNGQYDSFFFAIYNIEGDFLAAIQFSNEREAFGLFREDGTGPVNTTVDFIHGELQLLSMSIDLINNRWSAEFDGIPLFENETFTATGKPRTLGLISYEWLLGNPDPANYGDNWLLIDECSVWAIPPCTGQIETESFQILPTGEAQLCFLGEPGWTYQVEYADSLAPWIQDLPDSRFEVQGSTQMIDFTDSSTPPPATRFYRVTKTVTP